MSKYVKILIIKEGLRENKHFTVISSEFRKLKLKYHDLQFAKRFGRIYLISFFYLIIPLTISKVPDEAILSMISWKVVCVLAKF